MMAMARAQVGSDVGPGFDELGAILSLKDAVVVIGSLTEATGASLVAGRVASMERIAGAKTGLDMTAPMFVSARATPARSRISSEMARARRL